MRNINREQQIGAVRIIEGFIKGGREGAQEAAGSPDLKLPSAAIPRFLRNEVAQIARGVLTLAEQRTVRAKLLGVNGHIMPDLGEIAEATGVAPSTVRQHLRTGMPKLREGFAAPRLEQVFSLFNK